MKPINFKTSAKNHHLIGLIVARAIRINPTLMKMTSRLELRMDITACHCNDSPLDLDKILIADDFNLMHDVIGIFNHMDRKTGKLTDHFLPRMRKQKRK